MISADGLQPPAYVKAYAISLDREVNGSKKASCETGSVTSKKSQNVYQSCPKMIELAK